MDSRPRDERADILRDAAEWRGATPDERDRALWSACLAAAWTVASRPDRDRVLAFRDELPESSRRLLARLKAEHRHDRAR